MVAGKGYRGMRVWHDSMDLVVRIYGLTNRFPSHQMHGLTSQLRRAAVSIPSNIAEGRTRDHRKEYLHHVSMARGSLAELQTQVEIAARLEYISSEDLEETLDHTSEVARQLAALRNYLLHDPGSNSQHPKPNT